MIKVLFVCLGNICRSPLAEAIFMKEIQDQSIEEHFFADSAGTAAYHIGEPPDHRSRANALQNGVIIDHRARQVEPHDFREFDYLLAMDHSNYRHLASMAEKHAMSADHLYMMRYFQQGQKGLDVPDPYYGGHQGFQEVFDILQDANRGFIEHLLKTHPL